jgi:hypothetical protein
LTGSSALQACEEWHRIDWFGALTQLEVKLGLID